MQGNKCVILIGEDEEIERESLREIITSHFQDSVYLHVARNGAEALEKYKEHHPDVVLMDINMPVLNGLEAIQEMKSCNCESVYIILTSYDYFSYAQKAIRLGVEEFLLKPANANQIMNAVSKALGKIHVQHNEESQASMLLEKFQEMRPTMELQCLYTILSKNNEIVIQQELRKLNIHAHSGVCFVIHTQAQQTISFDKLKEDICDMGYACLNGYMNKMHVFFILSNGELRSEDLQIIEYVMARHHLQNLEIGIGSVQQNLENFYTSYIQAMNDLHVHQQDEPLYIRQIVKNDQRQQDNSIQEFVDELLTCFLRHDDEKLHSLVHAYASLLLMKDMETIYQEVELILQKLIDKLEKQYQQEIDRETLPHFELQEEQKYQNLEIQFLFILNTLFRPLKNTSYHQSNALVKKALHYIQHNFRKPISLNDVAKELQVTPFYVSKILKQYNDKNFTDLVSEYRIEEAKKYLRKGERVKEVAFAVGFQSQSYFAKTFKKQVGVTPSEYLNMFM